MNSGRFEKTFAVICFAIATAFLVLCIWSLFWQVAFEKIGIVVGIGGTAFFGNFGLNLWQNGQNALDNQTKRSNYFSRLKND